MEKVKDYLLDNMDVLKDVVRELNSWDGSFDNFDVHYNDEDFFDTFFSGNIMEAVRASHYGDYNFTDEFIRFNAYGNLETLSEYQLEQELKDEIDEIVDMVIEKQGNLYLDDELKELLEAEELEETEITEGMAVCSHCYYEFDLGEKAFIDSDGDYVCKDCAE